MLFALVLGIALLWVLGPRERVDTDITFERSSIGADIDGWLATQEASVPALRPAAAKRVVWAGEPGSRTPFSLVYLHGFSASAEEIRPVPDRVAQELGANLYFARFAGHGRDGPAMAEPRAGDWLEDFAEAMEIGRRIGEEIIILSTSTGGPIATIGVLDPVHGDGVRGLIFVSPNFE
ncbi:MAG: alpha/beta hydrolase, partial [Pseudomonadota bacterium]